MEALRVVVESSFSKLLMPLIQLNQFCQISLMYIVGQSGNLKMQKCVRMCVCNVTNSRRFHILLGRQVAKLKIVIQ